MIKWSLKKKTVFSPLLGEMIQFDLYFSNGLKPPTSPCLDIGTSQNTGQQKREARNRECEVSSPLMSSQETSGGRSVED